MFDSQLQKQKSQAIWRSKQIQYKLDSARKQRQNKMTSQRYLYCMQILNWKMNLKDFKAKIESVYNHFSLIKTLFSISEQNDWRSYVSHMTALISSFNKIIFQKKGSNINDIIKINNFQQNFGKLFLLKDQSLRRHLMHLIKIFLAYNGKYMFFNQLYFSQLLTESMLFYSNLDLISETLWILAQTKVSYKALAKILKLEEHIFKSLLRQNSCFLALLTVLGNFISNLKQQQQIIYQLITSNAFNQILNRGLTSNQEEIINQTILIFNNGLCYSSLIRQKLLQDKNKIEKIINSKCQERRKFDQIYFTLYGRYLNSNNMHIQILMIDDASEKFTQSLQTNMN